MLKSNIWQTTSSFDIYHHLLQHHSPRSTGIFTMLNDNGDLEQKESEQFFFDGRSVILSL
jgi:hypothetical protein